MDDVVCHFWLCQCHACHTKNLIVAKCCEHSYKVEALAEPVAHQGDRHVSPTQPAHRRTSFVSATPPMNELRDLPLI